MQAGGCSFPRCSRVIRIKLDTPWKQSRERLCVLAVRGGGAKQNSRRLRAGCFMKPVLMYVA